MERIVKRIELTNEEITRVLWSFGLTEVSQAKPLGGGRIANNILVQTHQMGDVIIRAYPHAYGEAKVRFEVDALQHLSERGCDVPRPVRLVRERMNHQAIFSSSEVEIFLYRALPGTTVSQAELSTKLAAAAAKALAKLVPHSSSFTPTDLIPHGDLGFIAGLLRAAKERDEALATDPITADMEAITNDGTLSRALSKASFGIVHADYFFENVLANDLRDSITGVLDFGDAYYGNIINDILIGAMEFSVDADETWNLDAFEVFLRENCAFLCRERLPSCLVRRLLLSNCIRFAIYTLPFSNAEGLSVCENRYVKRFIKILHTDFGSSLEALYSKTF